MSFHFVLFLEHCFQECIQCPYPPCWSAGWLQDLGIEGPSQVRRGHGLLIPSQDVRKTPEKPCPGTWGDQMKTYWVLCVPDLSNTPTLPLAALDFAHSDLSLPDLPIHCLLPHFPLYTEGLKTCINTDSVLSPFLTFVPVLITGFWLCSKPADHCLYPSPVCFFAW